MNTCVAHLSDKELIIEVKRLAASERHATVNLIASLMELDARRLYLAEGCSSLFTYCTQVLRLSEHAAYGRIEAARAARRFPIILEMLADGSVTLTAVGLLAPHLTQDNHSELLANAQHKTKREVEQIAAAVRPQPDVPPSLRKLPTPKTPHRSAPNSNGVSMATTSDAPSTKIGSERRAVLQPLAPERYRLQMTISRDTHDRLRRVQDLMRHTIPNGDPSAIFDRALTLLLQDLERVKLARVERPRATETPSTRSRHVAAAVKRAVWKRDGGRCAFTGTNGRCSETGFLEFHHRVPYADGGETTADNLELRCSAHNAYEMERWSGTLFARESGHHDRFEKGWYLSPDLTRSWTESNGYAIPAPRSIFREIS